MYKKLNFSSYSNGIYKIVPIRPDDRYDIMKWRNEQIYHLRQREPLTKAMQDAYFKDVVSPQLEMEQPPQILFSYLKEDQCIGYGGLVHINWHDKNAEISFIMATELEKTSFEFHWTMFLGLLEKIAFSDLKLHKIFTYAFGVRPHLFSVIESKGYILEGCLDQHYFFNEKFHQVKIHSKFRSRLVLRSALFSDVFKTYEWANNTQVRQFSFNKNFISEEAHKKWFYDKLEAVNCFYYILEGKGQELGSIRFDIDKNDSAELSFLIDPKYFGRGLGTMILKMGIKMVCSDYQNLTKVTGRVMNENSASKKIFSKLDFKMISKSEEYIEYELNLPNEDWK